MDTLDALVQALVIILFVGGLSLLAHWGRKNRRAEISLIVILLFVSSLVVILGILVALVGLSGTVPASDLPPELSASSAAVILLTGLAGLTLCVPPLRRVTRRREIPDSKAAKPGLEDFAPASHPPQVGASGSWWSDPPIFLGLWLFVMVLGEKVVELLTFALAPEAIESTFIMMGKLSPAAIVLNQLPFLAIALLGVGLGVERNFRQTISRLGYGPVTLRGLGLVALFVVGAFVLQFVFDFLFSTLQPDLYERVGRIVEGLFGTEGLSLTSTILFALLIGAGAALGEETLFRGAVQPALGIMLTSLLWASLHVQYGPSILLIYIFVIGLGLGFLRKYVNTTASFLAHATYNALQVLLAYFFGM